MSSSSKKSIVFAALASSLTVAAALGLNGVAGLGWHAAVRETAILAFGLWWLSFVAGPLVRLAPGRLTRTIRARRRELGLAFATVLAAHGLAILTLFRCESQTLEPGLELAVGALGFVFAFAMAATSTDAAVRRLGRSRWRALHLSGQALLAVIFLSTYAGRFVEDTQAWPGLGLVIGAIALRLAAGIQARRRRSRLPTE